MKKGRMVMLAALAALLTGCDRNDTPAVRPDAAAADPKPFELVFSHPLEGPAAAAIEDAVRAFDESRDDLTVRIDRYRRFETAEAIQTAVTSGSGPDVFLASDLFAGFWFERASILQPLGALLDGNGKDAGRPSFFDGFQEKYLARLSSDETVFGVPLAVRVPLLVANPDVVKRGYAIRARPVDNAAMPVGFDESDWMIAPAFIHAFGGNIIDGAGTPGFDSEQAVRALKFMSDHIAGGSMVATGSASSLLESFNRGSLPAIIVWPESVALIESSSAWTVMPMPGIEGAGRVTPWWHTDALFLSSWSRRYEAGSDLIRWLSSAPTVESLARNGFPGLSVTKTGISPEYEASALSSAIRAQQTVSMPAPATPAFKIAVDAFDPVARKIASQGKSTSGEIAAALKTAAEGARSAVTKLMQSSLTRMK